MAVLAIDQGTSATKAIVVDDTGGVIAVAEIPITVVSGAGGMVEIDAEQLWESVVHAGRAAWSEAGNPVLDGIGLANQGETVLAWDRRTGTPQGPAIVWQDRRSAGVCDALHSHGPRLAEITGLELDPYFVAPKIAWLRQRIGRGPTITTTDTWLLHRLCGAFVTDVATAGRSLLLDIDDLHWNDEACEIFGIEPGELPSVVGNAEPVGTCSTFGQPAPITGVCVDQQAALFAERCTQPGDAKCTYGTGAFMLACSGDQPRRSTNGLVGCPAWSIGERSTWCLDGQVYTAGAAVTWLHGMGIIGDPGDLDRLGATVTDSDGVIFVPALAGLAAPYWNPTATASLTGLSLSTEPAHVVRAAIDGIAAQVALLAIAVGSDLGEPLARLRVDGGLTRSHLLLQRQADLAQLPVEVYPSPHATALGIAAFARIGAGLADGPIEWVADRAIEPCISPGQADDELHRWQAAAEATTGR